MTINPMAWFVSASKWTPLIAAAIVSMLPLGVSNIAWAQEAVKRNEIIAVKDSHGDNWSVGTHCGENVPLFNARVEGSDKVVSICEHEGGGSEPAGLSYHFGKLGKIELSYPSKFGASWNDFTFRSYVRPRTTYQKLEFDNGGYRYAILEEFDNGAYGASLRITRLSDKKVVFEKKLKPTTEPLALVKISGKVHTAPFDE